MRLIKVIFFVLCVGSVIAVSFLWLNRSRHAPLTLSFIGYNAGTNGLLIASFCASNHSARPVAYMADGPSAPHYSLIRQIFHDPNTGLRMSTNYNAWFSFYPTQLTLLPGGSVTFPVPMVAGTNDTFVGINYLPERSSLDEAAKSIQLFLTGRYAESLPSVVLQGPFE